MRYKQIFATLAGVLTTFSKLCFSNSDFTDLLNFYAKRDIIMYSSTGSNSTAFNFLSGFQTSQIALANFQNIQSIGWEEFTETLVIISDLSLIEKTFPKTLNLNLGPARGAKVLILAEGSRLILENVEKFVQQNLPYLTDVFFGSDKNMQGLTCVKTVCNSMELKSFVKRRKNFLGVELKMAMVIYGQQSNFEELVGTNSNDSLNLYMSQQEINIDLLVGLRHMLNFSVAFYSASEWAILYANGSWAGMAKFVDSGEVDIALSRTYILPYRVKHFRFLVVVYTERLLAYYHPAAKETTDILAMDFDFRIWIVLIGQIIASTYLLKVICGLDISGAVLQAVGSISQQGSSHHQNHCWNQISSRTLYLILNLSGLLFYIFFSALLVSTFSIEANVIKTLEDLLRRNYNFGMLHDSYLIKEDAEGTTPKGSKLGQIMANLNAAHKAATLDIGSRAVMHNEQFAFLSEMNLYSLFPGFATNQEICNGVKELPIDAELIKSSAFVTKDSPYAEYLNFAYLTMLERGVTPRFWKSDTLMSMQVKPSCEGDKKSKRGTIVDLAELRTVFLLMVIGQTLSFLVLFFEIVLERK